MKKYLVDVNLPYLFSFWNANEYEHVRDINDGMKDEEIWNFAKDNNLTIITKDSDFSNRMIVSSPPPKVIHIKIGNVGLKELHHICGLYWPDVIELNKDYKLVNVFKDRIEAIE